MGERFEVQGLYGDGGFDVVSGADTREEAEEILADYVRNENVPFRIRRFHVPDPGEEVPEPRYKIVRMYESDDVPNEVIARGLTKDVAQAHCNRSESSSSTAVGVLEVDRTNTFGRWFDAWSEE